MIRQRPRNFSISFAFTGEPFTPGITSGRLVFTGLTLQSLNILTVTIDFGLVAIDLLLLLIVCILVTLQLITNQCTGAETQRTADQSASCGTPYGRADDAAGGSAAQGADTGAFLACAEGTAGAT
jgi:hypothetical protein